MLYAKIGELTVERDVFARGLSHCGRTSDNRQAPTAESALRMIQTAWADDEAALLKVLRAYQP